MDETTHDALNRFWNELVTSGEPGTGEGLPLEDAETVQRLYAMSRTSPPRAVQQQLDRQVFLRSRTVSASTNGAAPHWTASGANPWDLLGASRHGRVSPLRPVPLPAPATPLWYRRVPMVLATTLLLLVTVALGIVTMGLGRQGPQRGIVTDDAPLAEVTLPAALLPKSDRASASLAYYTLEPAQESVWTAEYGACCPGLRADYVLTGELTVRPAGAAYVVRNGTSQDPELVPDGSDVVITPGDVLMTRYQDAASFQTANAEPVGLLDVALIDGYFPLITEPPGWTWHPDSDGAIGLLIPQQDLVLRLEALNLAAGESLPLPPGALTQMGVTLVDGLPLESEKAGPITNPNPETVTVHLATLLPGPTP